MDLKTTIRTPTQEDYHKFLAIYQQFYFDPLLAKQKAYVRTMENKGFLVGRPFAFKDSLAAKFFKCVLLNQKPVGFIRLDHLSHEMCSSAFTLKWQGNLKIWNAFCEQRGVEIGIIVVEEKYKGKGIAHVLLEEAERFARKAKYKNLFSWVVTHPQNKPSLRFHRRNGFTEVAFYEAKKAWGIQNYASVLFWKQL